MAFSKKMVIVPPAAIAIALLAVMTVAVQGFASGIGGVAHHKSTEGGVKRPSSPWSDGSLSAISRTSTNVLLLSKEPRQEDGKKKKTKIEKKMDGVFLGGGVFPKKADESSSSLHASAWIDVGTATEATTASSISSGRRLSKSSHRGKRSKRRPSRSGNSGGGRKEEEDQSYPEIEWMYERSNGVHPLPLDHTEGRGSLTKTSTRSPRYQALLAKVVTLVRTAKAKVVPSSREDSKVLGGFNRLDAALFLSALCGSIAVNIPTILLPAIGADPTINGLASVAAAASSGPLSIPAGGAAPVMSAAALAASVAAMSSMGGAAGNFCNGFLCKKFGGRKSSTVSLVLLAASSALLATARNLPTIKAAVSALEFGSCMIWIAFSSVLARHYSNDARSYGKALTLLGLADPIGSLVAKLGFASLLTSVGWRTVARCGVLFALLGIGGVQKFVQDSPERRNDPSGGDFSPRGVARSVFSVLGNPLFWAMGLHHAVGFLARTSDKILGAFFQEVTMAPSHLCGGLTSFLTLGMMFGLVTGNKFHAMEDSSQKRNFLLSRYAMTIVSPLLLAFCATSRATQVLGHGLSTLLGAVASAVMGSSIAFQWVQLPGMFAKGFGDNSDICLSLLGAMGHLLSGNIWSRTGRVIASGGGTNGWSVAWVSMSMWFFAGAAVMMKVVPGFVEWKESADCKRVDILDYVPAAMGHR